MNCLQSLTQRRWMCGIAAVLLCGLSTDVATAQSVAGNGIQRFEHGAVDGYNFFREVSVNAWLDDGGVAHGMIAWRGDVFQSLPGGNIQYGGPANTYFFEVTDIFFYGNEAEVWGTVIASPEGIGNGLSTFFYFTDNSSTGEPDELDGSPIDAGNYVLGN